MKENLAEWFNVQGRELEVEFCRSLERCVHYANNHGMDKSNMDIGRLIFFFHKGLLFPESESSKREKVAHR